MSDDWAEMDQGSLQDLLRYGDPQSWRRIQGDPVLWLASLAQVVAELEKTGVSSRTMALREWWFELDPHDRINTMTLLHFSASRRDEWSVWAYTGALLAAWQTGDPPLLAQVVPLLDHLLAYGLGSVVLELGEGLASRQTDGEVKRGILAVLAQLARQWDPERLGGYAGGWEPMDLAYPTAAGLIKALHQGSLAVALGVMASARELPEDSIGRLGLLANGIRYLSTAGHLAPMQAGIAEALKDWSLDQCLRTGRLLTPEEQQQVAFIVLFVLCYDWPYVEDNPDGIQQVQAPAAARFCQQTQARFRPQIPLDPQPMRDPRPLKVGYLSSYFRRHSVGFLSQQILAAHDPTQVTPYLYQLDPVDPHDDLYQAFRAHAGVFRECWDGDPAQVTDVIRADGLDVLVLMSGLEHRLGCEVISLRAAPVQLSWLAGDSPRLPTLDGMLVDPHLVPEDAASRYHEKMLFLPAFAAVSEFALDPCPDLREKLGIPAEAVVLWTAAPAKKRSPLSIRCQLEILAQVPNSVLIVKGSGDTQAVINLFRQVIPNADVSQRIRFLARTLTQEQHRGQVAAVDLVLDTFPYAGSTHTLEALSLGIPVLTVAGQHYYTRQSYSLLKALNLHQCITWDPRAYVQQGIRLAQDPDGLAQLKATIKARYAQSPVGDPVGVARGMEKVYREWLQGSASRGGT